MDSTTHGSLSIEMNQSIAISALHFDIPNCRGGRKLGQNFGPKSCRKIFLYSKIFNSWRIFGLKISFWRRFFRESANGDWIEECRLEQHRDWVRDVAWAPTVGLEFSMIASCSQDCRVVIWKCRDLDSQNWQPTILHQFDDVVWHVSWSICGTILAVSCGDNKVRTNRCFFFIEVRVLWDRNG